MVDTLSSEVGTQKACDSFGIARSSYYYRKHSSLRSIVHKDRKLPDFAYTLAERQEILNIMNSDIYMNQTPYEIFASTLDTGKYLCSISTMYRILTENNQVKERRNIKRSANYKKPELLATNPNQVWSWDITKLKGYQTWTYIYLYVIIDIFSRRVVGWLAAHRESSSLAKKLIKETCLRQKIKQGQLTIHADRGSSMKSKTVAFLLSDLGVTKSHSRPYVSNDNPFSESQFKTMKYRPEFPKRFSSLVEAREFCRIFFKWYNEVHYHSGIGFLTPDSLHYGFAEDILKKRGEVMLQAYENNPKRFRFKKPKMKNIPKAVWINKPDNIEKIMKNEA